MRLQVLLLSLFLACASVTARAQEAAPSTAPMQDFTVQDFETEGAGTPYVLSERGAKPGPEVKDGGLLLVNGMRSRGPLDNSIAFARTAEGCHRVVRAAFTLVMEKGAHGGAFALLATDRYGAEGPAPAVDAWEEPNLPATLALGIDSFDPPTSHWFDANGNVHDQPQREFSLHWDGKELLGALSPVEFRDGEPHRIAFESRFDAGGAFVTLTIDDEPIWRERFVPGIRPYEARVAFGGRTGPTSCVLAVDDVKVEFLDPAPAAEIDPKPLVVRTMERPVFFAGRREAIDVFHLPGPDYAARRIILSLTLKPGPGGWDEWDRGASVFVVTGDGPGERVEILRWITPFAREYTWRADVTDYQSLLRGDTRLGVSISSWKPKDEDPARQKGFRVILDFAWYPGKPEREAYRVVNLWNLFYRFGNTVDEIRKAFPPKEVEIPEGTVAAKTRITVTGHGSFGEFTAAERTLTVNGQEFANTLFKTDVYLNPCRPQGGTWKFNRAGWGPGSLVDPWDVDLTALAAPGTKLRLAYEPKPFAEPTDGRKFEASHSVASHLILYREPK